MVRLGRGIRGNEAANRLSEGRGIRNKKLFMEKAQMQPSAKHVSDRVTVGLACQQHSPPITP